MTDDNASKPPPDAPRPDGGHPVGLGTSQRFKCDGCGNLTRFDVDVVERVRRFWHVALSGEGQVEQTEMREQTIEAVTCRWCGSSDRIVTEPAPMAGVEQPT